MFGTMCRTTRARPCAPSARAARTYSVSFSASTVARTIRATVGVPQMPTATVVFTAPGPSAATIAIASNRYGKASRISTPRMITASTQPPAKPATAPIVAPAATATATASTPTSSATRVP